MTEKWYAKSPEAVAEQFGTSVSSGLSPKAARARLREEGENEVFALPHTPATTDVAYVLSDVSMLLLALTAILAAVWGHTAASGAIFAVLAFHCLAAIFTYIKSRRIFESMAVAVMPRVRVLRGGRVYAVDARELVRGDVVLLRPGDMIACDARLCETRGLSVLEYSGKVEGKPVRGRKEKDAARVFADASSPALGEQTNMVFAGSVVLGGEGRAVVVETGRDTFLVSTEGPMPLLPQRDCLPALEGLRKHCRRSSLCMLLLILPLTVLGLLIPGELNLLDYFLLALALAVSSMSELTAAIGSIIVGAGVLRAAKDADATAILPHLADLPALARADTLVLLDDTALTEGKLAVSSAMLGTTLTSPDDASLRELYESALIAAGLPSAGGVSTPGELPDPAMSALLEVAEVLEVRSESLRERVQLCELARPEAGSPMTTALILEGGAPYVVCSGDAMTLAERCDRVLDPGVPGGTAMLRADRRETLRAAIASATAEGGYAVAYARRSSPYNTLTRRSALENRLTLIGVLVFRDPIGAGVPDALAALREAGVRTVLMADRPTGGGSIETLARAVGLLDGGTVSRAPSAIGEDTALCIGYSTAERRAQIAALREAGATVIALGSRPADLAPMQAASVAATCAPISDGRGKQDELLASIDGGADYGCPLLKKNAGLLVHRPGEAGSALAGVAAARLAARRIEANLASALRCLLSAQAMRIAALVCLLLLHEPILTPLQLLFGGLILDFGAILVCAFDCGRDRATDGAMFARPIRACLPRLAVGVLCGIAAAAATVLAMRFGLLPGTAASGFAFVSLTLGQLALLFACRRGSGLFGRSRMGLLWPVAVLGFLVFCFVLPAVGGLFGVTLLPAAGWACLAVVPTVALFGGEIVHTADSMRAERETGLEEEWDDAA